MGLDNTREIKTNQKCKCGSDLYIDDSCVFLKADNRYYFQVFCKKCDEVHYISEEEYNKLKGECINE